MNQGPPNLIGYMGLINVLTFKPGWFTDVENSTRETEGIVVWIIEPSVKNALFLTFRTDSVNISEIDLQLVTFLESST